MYIIVYRTHESVCKMLKHVCSNVWNAHTCEQRNNCEQNVYNCGVVLLSRFFFSCTRIHEFVSIRRSCTQFDCSCSASGLAFEGPQVWDHLYVISWVFFQPAWGRAVRAKKHVIGHEMLKWCIKCIYMCIKYIYMCMYRIVYIMYKDVHQMHQRVEICV